MTDPALIAYIRNKFEAGSSENEIRKFLLEEGWTEIEVDEAINSVKSEIQMKSFDEEAGKIEQEKIIPSLEQKAILGTALSLIAGLLLINSLPSLVNIADIQSLILPSLEIIGISVLYSQFLMSFWGALLL